MNMRLHDLVDEAEIRLAASEQMLLADLVSAFVIAHTGPLEFDQTELAHLKMIDAQPFDPADAAEVEILFRRLG